MPELLIGCGGKRVKRIWYPEKADWTELTTLDIEAAHEPAVVHDLDDIPLPFDDDSFDEIHAYDVLEHIGTQGDWRFFFREWADFWRILKPGGTFFGVSPAHDSPWAWGDPGHTRIISPQCLVFLDQTAYVQQVGQTAMTDYRSIYRADFERVLCERDGEEFSFALKAVKPSRINV